MVEGGCFEDTAFPLVFCTFLFNFIFVGKMRLRRVALGALAGVGLVTALSPNGRASFLQAADGSIRFARALSAAVVVGVDYKWTAWRHRGCCAAPPRLTPAAPDEEKRAEEEAHVRSAARLLKLCLTSGGARR